MYKENPISLTFFWKKIQEEDRRRTAENNVDKLQKETERYKGSLPVKLKSCGVDWS